MRLRWGVEMSPVKIVMALTLLFCRQVVAQVPGPPDRNVSWSKLAPNIAHDQADIWTFPARVYHRNRLYPVLGVLAITAGLIALDPVDARYFRRTNTYKGFNSVFSSSTTAWGTALVPASLYAAGLVRTDSYAKKTALLAGEAVVDAEILDAVIKRATSRVRPGSLPPNDGFGDTWFELKNGYINGHGSFVSGHAIAGFAVATIIARRYRSHRWVPYVAYGLAAAVGVSRLSLSAHYGSDVFLGAALGYAISRFSVLHE